MNELRGSRVVIIDDDSAEAVPIVKAFSKRGIATAFFDGTREGLPLASERLAGVRLAVLDMDLTGGGTSDKDKLATLTRVLGDVLAPENGPYAILAWTKNMYLVQEFEEYLFKASGIPKPIVSTAMQKADCKRGDDFDLDKISRKLRKCFNAATPLAFLEAWEGRTFEAATRVTNSLSNISDGEDGLDLSTWRKRWNDELLQLMRALAGAEAGDNLQARSCLYYFYSALNPLHADGMDRNTKDLPDALQRGASAIFTAAANCGADKKARLNSMLHLSFERVRGLAPGNLYVFSRNVSKRWVPTVLQLLDDLVEGSGDTKKKNKLELAKIVRRIAIEVSAICDHAQGNIRVPRFLSGLMVPADQEKKIKKKTDFVWRLGPLQLEGDSVAKGRYFLYASFRHLTTEKVGTIKAVKAFGRVRAQALTDLQARLSRHAGRPAVMLLE